MAGFAAVAVGASFRYCLKAVGWRNIVLNGSDSKKVALLEALSSMGLQRAQRVRFPSEVPEALQALLDGMQELRVQTSHGL